jgi:tetratricopeptide (TPR) repeat protein
LTQENLSERLNLYEAMFERNPRDGLVSVGKTYLYILSDRPQDALKSALEASLSVSSKSLRVQLAIALGYYLRNKPGEALIESRYALNIDPASPLCHLVHASILLALRRTDEAKLAFLKCLSLSSDNTFLTDLRLRNRRAICAAQLQNPLLAAYSNLRLRVPDMTEAGVQQLVEQNPTDPVLKALFASLQRRSGKIREALVLLERGLASYEAFPERLYLLWKTYDNQLGNHQKGELFVRRLLEVDPLNDRATSLGYSNLDEETLRHINFIKSLEDLPDSIFAAVLPVRELENLIGTTEADVLDITALTPFEERQTASLERTFTLPGTPQRPQVPEPEASAEFSPAVASLTSEEPAVPSQPVMAHMASMLEQAQLIARDLRPTPAMKPAPEQPRPLPPVEPDVDTVLQKEEPAAESAPIPVPEPQVESIPDQPAVDMPGAPVEASPVSSVPQPVPTTDREPVSVAESVAEFTSSERPSQPAEPAHVTMRYANSLLEDSRFEEALQAFLELSHKS